LAIVAMSMSCDSRGACDPGPDRRLDRYQTDDDAQRLVGMGRTQVVALLGEPTSERFSPEWDASYWVRPLGYCVDALYLVVEYGGDNVVSRAELKPG